MALFLSAPLLAAPCAISLGDLSQHGNKTIEYEADLTPEVMNLLTTPDGTLAPIFRSRAIPAAVKAWAKNHGMGVNAKNIQWEPLPFEFKLEILNRITRGQKFFIQRRIRGLIVKEKIDLKIRAYTPIFGVNLKPGTYSVDTGSVFLPYIEMRDMQDAGNVTGIEFHLRPRKSVVTSAANLPHDVWKLMSAAGIRQRDGLHEHNTKVIPIKSLRERPISASFQMADWWMRAELLMQLVTIRSGGRIYKLNSSQGDIIGQHFGTPDQKSFYAAPYYWMIVAKRNLKKLSRMDQLFSEKIAWLGFGGAGKYDDPGVWGVEFRSLSPQMNVILQKEAVTLVDQSMPDKFLPPLPQHLEEFFKETSLDDVTRMADIETFKKLQTDFSGGWYLNFNEKASTLHLTQVPGPSMERPIREKINKLLISSEWSQTLDGEHIELAMLNHDWSTFPLFSQNQDLLIKIRDAQIEGLLKLAGHRQSPNDVMKRFIKDSGIWTTIKTSLETDAINMRLLKELASATD